MSPLPVMLESLDLSCDKRRHLRPLWDCAGDQGLLAGSQHVQYVRIASDHPGEQVILEHVLEVAAVDRLVAPQVHALVGALQLGAIELEDQLLQCDNHAGHVAEAEPLRLHVLQLQHGLHEARDGPPRRAARGPVRPGGQPGGLQPAQDHGGLAHEVPVGDVPNHLFVDAPETVLRKGIPHRHQLVFNLGELFGFDCSAAP
mmetsp:Transcript_86513/g.225717  ORF Transcript_86513/g.225717 Transcript_86513/m.225717 type:complete len:201 (-) Transcript_86513:237-839(-)